MKKTDHFIYGWFYHDITRNCSSSSLLHQHTLCSNGMDLCINLQRKRIIISHSNTKDEIEATVHSLISRAETADTTGGRVHRSFRTSSFAFYEILKYEFSKQRKMDDKILFAELRTLNKKLRKLMKSMEFLQDRRRNDTVNMFGILRYLRSPEFKLCDLTIELVEGFERTIWLLDVLFQEIESTCTELLDRIKSMKERYNIHESLGLIAFQG